MAKLVQYIEFNLPNAMLDKMYCYGEASFEANASMQEPLEKLYKYENQPDMREKVKEYISELDVEINRCTEMVENNMKILGAQNLIDAYVSGTEYIKIEARLQALMEVKNDLQGRLEELI